MLYYVVTAIITIACRLPPFMIYLSEALLALWLISQYLGSHLFA